MPEVELPALNKVIRSGWKQLANCDQSDADEVVKILKEVLDDLERLEAPGIC